MRHSLTTLAWQARTSDSTNSSSPCCRGLADGDYRIGVTQNGINVPQTMYLTVHN